jgi:predicted porin
VIRIKSLALAAAAACVAAPAMADLKNVDIYGVVALGAMSTENGAGHNNTEVLNESRIGFRGSKPLRLTKLGQNVEFIWQIESGFLGPNGLSSQTYESGALGTRDTFAGLTGGFGKIRIGRLLTPYGETLDWPFANGGTGPLVEATNVPGGGSYVRISDQLRWDSPKWSGFSLGASYGRGDRNVGKGNGFLNDNSTSFSTVGHYEVGGATLHAGYERNSKRSAFEKEKETGKATSNNSNWLLAAQSPSFGGFSLYGAYLHGTSKIKGDRDYNGFPVGDYKRPTYQLALQYSEGDFTAKITHARNGDLKGPKTDVGGNITAVQALYMVDPAVATYARYVKASNPSTTQGWWNKSRILLGFEYYF